MIVAVIEQNLIVRLETISEKGLAEGYQPNGEWLEAGADWDEGGLVIDGVYTPPPPIEVVPDEISDRQFFQQLAVEKLITEAEALAAVATGTIPAAMQALIAQLPANQQFAAKMLVSGATIFKRLHPVAEMIRQLYQWTLEKRDAFWLAASKL